MIRKLLPLFVMIISLSCVNAQDAEGTAKIKFKGTSTLHDFEGSAESKVIAKKATEKGIVKWNFISELKVKTMNTNKDSRDKNMMKMFNETKFPIIEVSIKELDDSVLKAAETKPQSIICDITISGIKNSIQATISSVTNKDEALNFALDLNLSLKQFKLKNPTAMLGMVKVGDQVKVTIDTSILKEKKTDK